MPGTAVILRRGHEAFNAGDTLTLTDLLYENARECGEAAEGSGSRGGSGTRPPQPAL